MKDAQADAIAQKNRVGLTFEAKFKFSTLSSHDSFP
jgi:hypothetical protein